jgi:outer membrane protein assembly factor BamB
MRRTATILPCAVLVLVLSGCWPVPGQNADRTGHNGFERAITPATVADLEQAWASSWPGVGTPVVSSGGIHVVIEDPVSAHACALITLRPSDGEYLWHAILAEAIACGEVYDATTLSDPFVIGGQVVVGFETLYALRGCCPALWQYDVGSRSFDVATGVEGAGWVDWKVGSVRGDLAVTMGGTIMWPPYSPNITQSTGLESAAGGAAPLSIPGSVEASTTIGRDAVLHTGHGLLATTPGDTTTGIGVRSYPLSGLVNTCGTSGTESCPRWATPVDGAVTGPPVLGDGGETVFAATTTGTTYALDGDTGAVRWSTPVGAAVTASPALAGGVLHVPTASGELVAIDATDGTVLWRGATGSAAAISGQPASAGGVVFTGSADGRVSAFDAAGCGAASCGTLWSASAGTAVTGAPAVSNGQLYVPNDDGLTAYRLPG